MAQSFRLSLPVDTEVFPDSANSSEDSWWSPRAPLQASVDSPNSSSGRYSRRCLVRCSMLDHQVQRRFRCTPCSDTTDDRHSYYQHAAPDDDGDDCDGDGGGDDAASDPEEPASTVRSRTSRNPVLVT